jgi:hypothetical protein
MNTPCNSCKKGSQRPNREGYGFWAGLLLALLPKCPFCVMAFTGTALLCGEGAMMETTLTHNNTLTILITGSICVLTTAAILLNRRGRRTWYAMAIASMGMAAVMYSVMRSGGQPLYYSGVLLVFLGVWLNGSLLWLVKGWRSMSGQWKPEGTN